MIDTTIAAVNNALIRARANLAKARQAPIDSPAPDSAEERSVVTRFVRAYEAADVPALIALFTDDVFLSMPPLPLEYEGVEAATEFMRMLLVPGRHYRLLPTRANEQPAFAAYRLGPEHVWRASGLFVLTLSKDRINAAVRFEPNCLGWFGMPAELPDPTGCAE